MINLSADLLLSILQVTRTRTETSLTELASSCKSLPEMIIAQLESLADANLLTYDEDSGSITIGHRLGVAMSAINAGADIERVSRLLTWQEFEEIAKESFEKNGFSTRKHVVFKLNTRRHEIDLLGLKEPSIIVGDCKRWRRNQASRLNTAAANQLLRTEAFQQFLPKHLDEFRLQHWRRIQLIPTIIEIATRDATLYDGVPIVPVLKLHSFLEQIDPFIPGLATLEVSR